MSIGRTTTEIGANDFTHPTYRAVWELVEASGGTAAGADDHGWVAGLRERATDPAVAAAVTALGVEPLKKEPDASPTSPQHVVRLLELTALRRIAELKSKLQRTNPVEHADDVQPDVRRAGRARGAPPHAARPDRRSSSEAAAHRPGRRGGGGGEGAGLGGGRRPASSPAPGRRSTCPDWRRGSRGSRSRPPTGTRTPRRSGSARSAPGASRGRRTRFVLTEPGRLLAAGPGAGHGHAWCSSDTCRSAAAAASG